MLVFFAFVLLLILYELYTDYTSRRRKVDRRLRKLPKVPIGRFSDGQLARTNGRIQLLGRTVKAPLSGIKCCYYHLIVQQYMPFRRRNGTWMDIIKEEMMGDIVIRDGKQYLYIDSEQLTVYSTPANAKGTNKWEEATPQLKRFLEDRDVDTTILWGFQRSFRYRLVILKEGEWVTVGGVGTWTDKRKNGVDIPTGKYLLLTPPEGDSVYITNLLQK